MPKYGTVSQVLLQLVVAIISRVFQLILVQLFYVFIVFMINKSKCSLGVLTAGLN